MADTTEPSTEHAESDVFRLGRATWLLSTLLTLVDDGQIELSGGLEDSIREFVTAEAARSQPGKSQ